MIRCLVREVVVKLPIALAVTSLIAGCGPVHFGVAQYRASRQGDMEAAAEQPSAPAEQDTTTHPPIPPAFIRPPGTTTARAAAPEPDTGGDNPATSDAVSQPQELAGVVAVRRIDAATLRLGPWVSFSEVFRQGQVPAGSRLVARIGEREAPVKIDVESKYPDGSIRSGTITIVAGNVGEIVLLRR
jgi:hypothetical protein